MNDSFAALQLGDLDLVKKQFTADNVNTTLNKVKKGGGDRIRSGTDRCTMRSTASMWIS